MHDHGTDRSFFAARGFGRTLGLGRSPAVVAIDLQRAFTDPTSPLGADVAGEVAATQRLVAAAREAGAPVVYTAVRFDEPEQRDAGIWGIKIPSLAVLAAQTDGVALDPRLDVRASDRVIWKKAASGFFNTDLAARLTVARVDSLLVTGVTTSGCVRATVVDAISWGFRTAVVREGVADRARAAHEQSLFDLEQKYCDVIALDDALAYLSSLRATQPQETAS